VGRRQRKTAQINSGKGRWISNKRQLSAKGRQSRDSAYKLDGVAIAIFLDASDQLLGTISQPDTAADRLVSNGITGDQTRGEWANCQRSWTTQSPFCRTSHLPFAEQVVCDSELFDLHCCDRPIAPKSNGWVAIKRTNWHLSRG
jgi:hypothetical protein